MHIYIAILWRWWLTVTIEAILIINFKLSGSTQQSYRQGLDEDTWVDLDDFVETDLQHRVEMDDLSVRLKIISLSE